MSVGQYDSVKLLKTRYPEIKGVHISCTLFLQKPHKALTEMTGKNLEKVPLWYSFGEESTTTSEEL